jgi:uncharacterized protein
MNHFSQPCQQQLFELTQNKKLYSFLLEPQTIFGCIFAVAAAPEIPLPTTWLPWIFNGSVDQRFSKQIDQITELTMLCLQWQLKQMRDGNVELMEGLTLPQAPYKESALAYWMRGLLLAHSNLTGTWQKAWNAMLEKHSHEVEYLQKDLKHCLNMFSTFADIPFALQQAKSKGNHQLEVNLAPIFLSLPDALRTYVKTSGRLVDYLPNQFETFVQTAR